MAASKEMGYEVFGMNMIADKLYGTCCRRVFPVRQGRWVVQVPHDEMEEPVMNTKEVAARFGGVNQIKGKPQIRCGRPI